jgi:hypothetical protein
MPDITEPLSLPIYNPECNPAKQIFRYRAPILPIHLFEAFHEGPEALTVWLETS